MNLAPKKRLPWTQRCLPPVGVLSGSGEALDREVNGFIFRGPEGWGFLGGRGQ